MRIVIGVEVSLASTGTVEFVRRMSWPEGSEVVTVTALQPLLSAVPEAFLMQAEQVVETLGERRRAAVKHLEGVGTDLQALGLKVESRIVEGDPRDVLLDACREEKADLLIVGSHGRSGLPKLLMGSVASHSVTHAPCSVLVVRPSSTT